MFWGDVVLENIFDKVAYKYDKWYKTPVGICMDKQEKDAISDLLKGVRGNKLLEVGSGTGHWSSFFQKIGFEVVGLEISDAMLDVARSKKIAGVEFVKGDAHKIPFEDESFDVTAAITVLEFVEDYNKVLKEMWRVTRKGGRIVLGCLNRYSILSLKRWLSGSTTYRNVHMFSFWEIKKILKKFGRPLLIGSTFCLPWEWGLPYAEILENFGRAYIPFLGNFIAAKVEKYKYPA